MATGVNCFGVIAVLLTCIITRSQSIADTDRFDMAVDPWLEPVWFLEGDPFLLTCTANGSLTGNTNITWWKDAVSLGPHNSDMEMTLVTSQEDLKVTSTLKKDQASVDDSGRYYCWFKGDDMTIEVKVITVTSRDANLTREYPTTLTCDVEPYTPMCSILWLKGGVPLNKIAELQNRLVYGEHNTSVTINNSKLSDIGVYTCLIQFNKDTEFEQTFSRSLGIRGKPHIVPSEMTGLQTITNTSITVICPVKAYPEPEVFWKRGDDIIEASDRYILTSYNGIPDSRLEIKAPTESDYGNYVCVMENSMGKYEYALELKNDEENSAVASCFSWASLLSVLVVLHVSEMCRMAL